MDTAVLTPEAPAKAKRAIGIETVGMSKIFGSLVALDDVSIKVKPGEFHALLGENGAGKSTLVKCIMGFYQPTHGQLLVNGHETPIRHPQDARAAGIGMVYQHFTLVPCLTAAENMVISRANVPAVIDWKKEIGELEAFMDSMPFRVPLTEPVATLSAGEKQKLEILKQLYLDQRFLILDEPTSVLTPSEADEVLGLLHDMARAGDITVLMITHKFREVTAFTDNVSVLRRGKYAGGGTVGELSTADMSRMMIGEAEIRKSAERIADVESSVELELAGIVVKDEEDIAAVDGLNLKIGGGEIVGVAGVSGNGQSELVEALSGQRPINDGGVFINGEVFDCSRSGYDLFKVFGLPEEPLRNAAVPRMSVAENIAFRTFDKAPEANLGWWLKPAVMKNRAAGLIERYRVKTPSTDTPIENLSGGNVQRAILARELSHDVKVLIVANPCFGLDFASVAEIRAQIIDQRNNGAAVLLVSEDLDEILELSDRVAVMSEGKITYVAPIGETDRNTIGTYMAGH
ncbi:ABC transporter ATP-binding protein [Oricola sp.]|uniref:ABC transporter ATP-binding protein n=1 Tax=Oricola sp. TaxID=1979950 RepID=UPI00269CF93D|tara:strand:+ start:11408 stop:12958 length:1551 start_codon:yes stop_codon:yes gene_type:complete